MLKVMRRFSCDILIPFKGKGQIDSWVKNPNTYGLFVVDAEWVPYTTTSALMSGKPCGYWRETGSSSENVHLSL